MRVSRSLLLLLLAVACTDIAGPPATEPLAPTSPRALLVPGVYDAVSAGAFHGCGLSNGVVACWGLNTFGQTNVPSSLAGVVQLSAGGVQSCALLSGGTVTCWGDNVFGESTIPAGLAGVSQVSAGYAHTCALAGGTVSCWGDNTYGQLGATEVSDAVEISSGDQHVCVRHGNGSMSCWGYNGEGQLADGDAPNHSLTAVPVLGIDSADLISLGAVHSCARVSAEPVNFKCWGRGNFGQLGDGQYGGTHDVYAPVYVQGGEFDGVFGGSPGSFEGQ